MIINSVFFIFVMSRFYTYGDSRNSYMEMTFYNNITNINVTRKIDGEYYYKDGDTLSMSCSHTRYKNWLPSGTAIRLYHCKNGTWSDENLTGCAATGYRDIGRILTNLELDKHNDNDAIICEYKDLSLVSVLERLSTKIVLISDAPPTILVNNLHFNKSSSTPNIYKGTRGEKVRINCQKNEDRGTLHWDFCKNITQGNSHSTQVNNGKKTIYADLTLDEELNGTEIKCVFTNVKQRKTVTNILFIIRHGETVGSSQSNMTEMLNNSHQNNQFFASSYIWVIVGVGVLIIIILMIITVNVCKSKKSEQEEDYKDVTYENVSSAVPPFPNSAILEEMYLIPSDGADAGARATDNDVTYALPYIETNVENLYSKPLPKSLRNPKSQYPEISKKNIVTNEPIYADIYNLPNNDNKEIRKNIEYATVNGLNPNYTNVFVDETYVNGKDDKDEDYDEPNYCEVGNLIKDSS